jgi:hypothetical protein
MADSVLHSRSWACTGKSVLFTARGHVLRSYFPDAAAKGFAGVADMMADAARNIGP